MARLSRYLIRLFLSEAMALFAVAISLLFLIQCLRLFGLVSEKGQSMLTFLGQAALGMTSMAVVVLYVCLAIGLGRGLRGLQERSELQIIHGNALVGALVRSVFGYALGGAAFLLLLTNILDPLSVRTTTNWTASIAADLVSRSMIPHRFTEVADGVSFLIGSRDAEGQITDFFADDSRNPDNKRAYFAQSALITRDEQGFVLRMYEGAIQQLSSDGRLSQIAFKRYDLALDQLSGGIELTNGLASMTTIEIVREASSTGTWLPAQVDAVVRRSVEGLRVLATCLFAAAVSIFPTGNRRRFTVPGEIVILAAVFLERGVTAYVPLPEPVDLVAGPAMLALFAIAMLVTRFWILVPLSIRRPA